MWSLKATQRAFKASMVVGGTVAKWSVHWTPRRGARAHRASLKGTLSLIFFFLKHHELLTCVVLCKIPVRQLGFDSPTERTEHKNRPLDN